MFSGLMLSQYTADSLIVEQRILSAPSYTMSIPAAADQEDFVSMGMNTALKNRQILENAQAVLGIEVMAAAQASGHEVVSLAMDAEGARRRPCYTPIQVTNCTIVINYATANCKHRPCHSTTNNNANNKLNPTCAPSNNNGSPP